VACGTRVCGGATDNCGRKVPCGSAGTEHCPSASDVCTPSGTCCTPDNATACSGRCGGVMVQNNCGETISCTSCGSDAGSCVSAGDAANTCCQPSPASSWCAGRCGVVPDSCNAGHIDCGGCDGGTCNASHSCGCVTESISVTCANHPCGAVTNNCGQPTLCGNDGRCVSNVEQCRSNTCCAPIDATTCGNACNTQVSDRCGVAVTCGGCGSGRVCTSANQCCTPACSSLYCGKKESTCNTTCKTNCVANQQFQINFNDPLFNGKCQSASDLDNGSCQTAAHRIVRRRVSCRAGSRRRALEFS